MALIDHIDGANRDIYLSADTVGMSNLHPMDIFKEYRALRRTDENLRKFAPLMAGYGNVPKTATKATERYVMLFGGARLIPYDVSHTLGVIGVIITDDAQEGRDCFDRTPLSPTTKVEIDYSPPQVEVVTVSSGSGLSTAEHDKLMSVPTATTITADTISALTSRIIENGHTSDDLMRLMASVLLGKVTGSGTGTEKFRDLTDNKDRVTATIDSSGNRTFIVLDAN